MTSVTFSKFTGRNNKTQDILVDGEWVGDIVVRMGDNYITGRPEWVQIEVVIVAKAQEVFTASRYEKDVDAALRAAHSWVKAQVTRQSHSSTARVAARHLTAGTDLIEDIRDRKERIIRDFNASVLRDLPRTIEQGFSIKFLNWNIKVTASEETERLGLNTPNEYLNIQVKITAKETHPQYEWLSMSDEVNAEIDEMVQWFDSIGMYDVPSDRSHHKDGADFDMWGRLRTRW